MEKNIYNDIERVLLSEQEIAEICRRLGKQITEDYKDKKLLIVSVLKGSFIFMADLVRNIDLPCRVDFMAVSSYGKGTSSSGNVKIVKDLDLDLSGYDILVVEDILDSGVTLSYLKSLLLTRGPKSFKICTFLDKPSRRIAKEIVADYVGAEVPDAFVVGYGLDYDEEYRNVRFLGALKSSVYENK